MVTSDFRPEVAIRPFRACAIKNMQYNAYLWPNHRNFRVLKEIWVEERDGDFRFQTGSGNMAVSRIRHASGHNYRNSSFINCGRGYVADTTFHRTYFQLTVFSITVFAVCSVVTFAFVICFNNKESSPLSIIFKFQRLWNLEVSQQKSTLRQLLIFSFPCFCIHCCYSAYDVFTLTYASDIIAHRLSTSHVRGIGTLNRWILIRRCVKFGGLCVTEHFSDVDPR